MLDLGEEAVQHPPPCPYRCKSGGNSLGSLHEPCPVSPVPVKHRPLSLTDTSGGQNARGQWGASLFSVRENLTSISPPFMIDLVNNPFSRDRKGFFLTTREAGVRTSFREGR